MMVKQQNQRVQSGHGTEGEQSEREEGIRSVHAAHELSVLVKHQYSTKEFCGG